MTIEIIIDRDACQGAGVCVRRAPGSFRLDAERRSVSAAYPEDEASVIRAAADACPHFAIVVRDAKMR